MVLLESLALPILAQEIKHAVGDTGQNHGTEGKEQIHHIANRNRVIEKFRHYPLPRTLEMTTWVYRPNHPHANENGMVDRSIAGYEGSNSAPYVISDNMEPTKHHATGNMISSKRAFASETRAAGCVEIGNEPIKPRISIPLDKGQRRDAIRKTIYDLRNGRA